MRFIVLAVVIMVGVGSFWYSRTQVFEESFVSTEAGFEEVKDVMIEDLSEEELRRLVEQESREIPYEEGGRIAWGRYWEPFTALEAELYGRKPVRTGPPRVGVQAGHWRNDEVPEELDGLKRNAQGATGGGYTEQEVVYDIAVRVEALLEAEGVEVDLLPATIPVDYAADAFISIHADGNPSGSARGFKIAGPRYDFSGQSERLVQDLIRAYKVLEMPEDDNITRRMSGYYAFNWRRYDHALHPLTPAAIIETGFMTNTADRAVLIGEPDRVAEAITKGVMSFLDNPLQSTTLGTSPE